MPSVIPPDDGLAYLMEMSGLVLLNVPASVTFMTAVPPGSVTDTMSIPSESEPDRCHLDLSGVSVLTFSVNSTSIMFSMLTVAESIRGGVISTLVSTNTGCRMLFNALKDKSCTVPMSTYETYGIVPEERSETSMNVGILVSEPDKRLTCIAVPLTVTAKPFESARAIVTFSVNSSAMVSADVARARLRRGLMPSCICAVSFSSRFKPSPSPPATGLAYVREIIGRVLSSVPASVTFMAAVPSGSETDAMVSPAESDPDSDHHKTLDAPAAISSVNMTFTRRLLSITADASRGDALSTTGMDWYSTMFEPSQSPPLTGLVYSNVTSRPVSPPAPVMIRFMA